MFRYLAPIVIGAAVLATPLHDALACQCSEDTPAVNVESARMASFIFEARVVRKDPWPGARYRPQDGVQCLPHFNGSSSRT